MSQFVQIHTLTSYPAVLLNRDDVGFAKRLPFGGATRTRISSQCLKRHWRTFEGVHSLHELQFGEAPVPFSIRSRLSFERFVRQPLVDAGVESGMADAITIRLMEELLGKSDKAKAADEKEKKKDKKGTDEPKRKGAQLGLGEVELAPKKKEAAKREPLQTNQVVVLGRPELDFLAKLGKEIAEKGGNDSAFATVFSKDQKENLKQLALGSGLDAALFGRMVTSDILARGDAAIHVAHAMTVHAAEVESDYFSAIDDLVEADGELGSGHINSTELTSGLYYGYVVVDVPLLIDNLSGDRALASKVIDHLVHLTATVSPGAKLGSTAPYANASMVLVERGGAQPRTLANAFLKPVATRPDVLANAYQALATFLADDQAMYGKTFERKLAARGSISQLDGWGDTREPLAQVATFAAEV